MWGGWLSKKAFQKEFAMHRLTFDPGQHRVLLLVLNILKMTANTKDLSPTKFFQETYLRDSFAEFPGLLSSKVLLGMRVPCKDGSRFRDRFFRLFQLAD